MDAGAATCEPTDRSMAALLATEGSSAIMAAPSSPIAEVTDDRPMPALSEGEGAPP